MDRNKKTGESRGFAFIEFTSVEDARVWLTFNNGMLQVDGHTCSLEYSTGGDHDDDWYCFKVIQERFSVLFFSFSFFLSEGLIL